MLIKKKAISVEFYHPTESDNEKFDALVSRLQGDELSKKQVLHYLETFIMMAYNEGINFIEEHEHNFVYMPEYTADIGDSYVPAIIILCERVEGNSYYLHQFKVKVILEC